MDEGLLYPAGSGLYPEAFRPPVGSRLFCFVVSVRSVRFFVRLTAGRNGVVPLWPHVFWYPVSSSACVWKGLP